MLDRFIDKVLEKNAEVYGIEISLNGKVAARHDFVPEARHPIYSATKSFVATAAGIASDEGKFNVEDPAAKYLQDELKGLPAERREALKRITMERLMTMSVPGYPFRPEGGDWLAFSLNVPISPEAYGFEYSNIPAYLTGVAVEKAVDRNLKDYLNDKLFRKIGIEEPAVTFCPSGHFYGASGMELTVHELSRLGEVYRNLGCYEGERIVSGEWVRRATSKHIETREGGYGYFFWMCPGYGCRISGKWGQRCFILPAWNATITCLGNLKDMKREESEELWICALEAVSGIASTRKG